MRRKRGASEPCIKAKCNSQLFHNKRIAGFSATVPVVQIPTGFGCHRLQMCLGGTSEKGIPKRTNRIAHASEPERNTRNPPQHIEKLYLAQFWQASPLVQMQRKRVASEPCGKAESGSQPAHNKCIAGLSATVPEVQIPDEFGMPQIANVPRRCFWLGYPPNAQQNSTGI